jgi:small subunit ribosomal protein S4
MEYTGPVCRLCRREGEKLFLKGDKCTSQKCTLLKKNYAPGMHGPKSKFGKQSEYGRQLRAKQKAKRIFQVPEKQLKQYYTLATKKTGVTGEFVLQFLERRLDNVVYKAGFAASRKMARQLVNHGLIKINGRKNRISSRLVKVGDMVSVYKKAKGLKVFEGLAAQKDSSPRWLKTDLGKGEAEVAFMPEKDDLDRSINSSLIVEFYSK